MYPNLETEMMRKRITAKTMAALIGCNEKSFYNKMTGRTDFTLPEAQAILEAFPEFKLSYLFERRENAVA